MQVDAQPYPFTFDPASTALVIIDMQRDFVEPGGFGETLGNDVSLLQSVVPPLKEVLETARAVGLTVIHTREGHVPDLSDCPPAKLNRGDPSLRIGAPGPKGRILIRGEYGHDIIDDLAPAPGELVIDKPGKGSFHGTTFGAELQARGITSLVVTGVTTEVCVHTTVREANDRGYECLVLSDCVGSYFPEFQRIGLAMIAAQGGIFGWVAPSSGIPVRPCPPGGCVVTTTEESTLKLPWWVSGDTNAFFGLGFNTLVNVLVLSGLCLGVVNIPGSDVFGVILPALGVQLLIGNVYYTYLARRLARRENRLDVCAMPYGPSVPHMFIVVFVIMLPIYLATKDPLVAWASGLAWCFIIGIDRAGGGVRRAVHPPLHPAGRDARHARRDLDRVHLDAPGRPDVGGAVDRLPGHGDHPDRVLHRPEAAGQHPGRAGRVARRHRDRVDRWLHVGAGRGVGGPERRHLAPDGRLRPARRGPGRRGSAAGHGDPAGHLQLHRGHDQRRERGGGGRRVQPPLDPARRRRRRRGGLGARLPLPARRLHRTPGVEGRGRAHLLLARVRRGDRPDVLPRACSGCSGHCSRCPRSCRSCSTSVC